MNYPFWAASTEPGFENLVTGHNKALNLPVFGGWRRVKDSYESVIGTKPDGKHEWITRDKTSGSGVK